MTSFSKHLKIWNLHDRTVNALNRIVFLSSQITDLFCLWICTDATFFLFNVEIWWNMLDNYKIVWHVKNWMLLGFSCLCILVLNLLFSKKWHYIIYGIHVQVEWIWWRDGILNVASQMVRLCVCTHHVYNWSGKLFLLTKIKLYIATLSDKWIHFQWWRFLVLICIQCFVA